MEKTRESGQTEPPSPGSGARNELIAGVGAVSDKGIRSENQDRMSRIEAPLGELLIVADGVGGNVGGGTAAGLTIDTVEASIWNASKDADPQSALRVAIEAANKAVYEPAHSGDPNLHKMASTVVAVLIRDGTAFLAHVGDSRAYLLRGNELRRLTVDHTRIQHMLDAEQLTPEQAREHPDQGILTRAIGDQPEVRVEDGQPVRLQDGDGLLLCSDGLHGYVEDKVILDTIQSAKSPQEASEELLALAMKNGSRDNVTVQYARFQSPRAVAGTGEISGGSHGENRPWLRSRWVPKAAVAALALGVGVYFLYPWLHWGGTGGDQTEQLQQEYDTAVADVASLQTESDRAAADAAAEGRAVESLQHAADTAGDAQQKQAAANAAFNQASQTANEAHQAASALNSQVDSVKATIAVLNAKETRTDEEEQALASAKMQKQDLDGKLKTAKDEATQAERQVSARQSELNQATQVLARISSLPEAGGRGAEDIIRAFNEAKTRQTRAAERMRTAAVSLESAKRRRDDLARRLGRAVGSGAGSTTIVSGAPAIQLLILQTKAGDPFADSLRDYFQAHPVSGAVIKIAEGKALGATGRSGGSATVFFPLAGDQPEQARAVNAVSAQVESALREFLPQNRQPGAKVSVVIVSSVN